MVNINRSFRVEPGRSHRQLVVVVLLVVGAVALSACSTTEGFGKDVKHLGGGIENSAAANK
ncbi:MAG: entericidin A/B family lipoprotein [Phycisphaerales bacterium]|nr:entericidin A/B family lipoprotein [Phycisphaerales bacterium]